MRFGQIAWRHLNLQDVYADERSSQSILLGGRPPLLGHVWSCDLPTGTLLCESGMCALAEAPFRHCRPD